MKSSDPVQALRQPSPSQPATLLIDDLHIVMILGAVVTDEQHPATSAPSPGPEPSSAEETSSVLMVRCSPATTRGHDIPAAVTSPHNQRAHRLLQDLTKDQSRRVLTRQPPAAKQPRHKPLPFAPIEPVTLPAGAVYATVNLDRGDHMANWSLDEAMPAILAGRRTPLTLGEGIHWLLQQPEVLERNHCFMTIGWRLRKSDGSLDARTSALWISNGTGRDGPENRNAPKVGWCWAGNRHTWLGFASAANRVPLPAIRP
jgi:hypothetical protein